ncbi:MAG: TlpA family protein disulfide reductase [bacterium]
MNKLLPIKKFLPFVLGIFVILGFVFWNTNGQDVSNYIKYAPPMKDMVTGKEVLLKDYMDKIIVLEFFETWCPACVRSIPELNKFYQNLQSNSKLKDKVLFFSVLSSSSGDERSIKEFIKSKNIVYPVLMEEKPQLSYNLGVRYIPTIFIIKEGKVVYSKVGGDKAEVLIQNLEKFVK